MNIYKDISNLPKLNKPVITIGSFDGVHLGHRNLIRRIVQIAKEIGGEATLITFHPHPRVIIDPDSVEMLTTLEEKLSILKSLKVDNVIVVPFNLAFAQQAPEEYIEKFILEKINPACIIIGYDHKFGLNRQGDIHMLKQYEDRIEHGIVEISKKEIDSITISSSKIRAFLKSGDLLKANELLDYKYILSGTVVQGDKIGRQIDYPTANIKLSTSTKLIPKPGIYAAKCQVDGTVHNGMLYIGYRPTVSEALELKIEIHLFDFDQDIYGQEVMLSLYAHIREDKKLNSLEELKSALDQDKQAVEAFFEGQDDYTETGCHEVGLVILAYNSYERLESFLPAISDSYSEPFDIYVIDNNSDDDSISLIEDWFPEVRVIQLSQNYGFAEGYNRGLAQIDNRYLALVNDDVQITTNWLNPIIEQMKKDKTVGACMPTVLSYHNKQYYEYAGAAGGMIDNLNIPFCRGRVLNILEQQEDNYTDTAEIFWASGAAIVTRKDIFTLFEGFDKDYFAHQEEIDYCWRIKNAGYQILQIANSQVYHVGGSSLDYDNPKKAYLNFRNNHWTMMKNETSSRVLWILFIRIITDLASSVIYILQGKFKHFITVWKALGNAYLNAPKYINKRKRVAALIAQHSIGEPNTEGRYPFSLLIQYYLFKKKTFKALTE